jgi:hypothetical protein
VILHQLSARLGLRQGQPVQLLFYIDEIEMEILHESPTSEFGIVNSSFRFQQC